MKKLDPSNIEFGKRLRQFRLDKRLTIEGIAQKINVSPSTYREWESGRAITGNPYAALAQALGVSVHQILGIEDHSRDEILEHLERIEQLTSKLKQMI